MAGTESLTQRYEAPAVRPMPFLFIRSSQLLVCTGWPRGAALSPDQSQAVQAVTDLIRAAQGMMPALSWVSEAGITAIRPDPESAWLRRKLTDHPAVRISA